MSHATRIRLEARIADQLTATGGLAELRELPVIADREHEKAVSRHE